MKRHGKHPRKNQVKTAHPGRVGEPGGHSMEEKTGACTADPFSNSRCFMPETLIKKAVAAMKFEKI
ncbi:MAG: hypothetical protein PHE74_11285 [Comamonas sp.]|nr:hypothetical protein [Comamonas sp.]